MFSAKLYLKTEYTMIRYLLLITLSLWLLGCTSPQKENVEITTSIPPQKYFIEALLGDNTPVNVMVTTGNNHATYEPTPQQLRAVASSKVYVKIGELGFENIWLPKILEMNPAIKVINLSDDITPIEGHEGCSGNEHQHEGVDPHIWTSPRTMKIAVANLAKQLADIYPQKTDTINGNLLKLNAVIDGFDARLNKLLGSAIQRKILIFHPAYTYLARDYVFEQVAIEKDGKEPSAAYIVELVTMAKAEGIKSVFIQAEFDKRNGETIAKAIGGELITINPMNENWAVEMDATISKFEKALK